jgi:hypothetical protein
MSMNRKDELELAIADINAALNSGATSHSSDGQSTSWDQDALRRRLIELQDELDGINGKPSSRPFFYTVNLNTGGNE